MRRLTAAAIIATVLLNFGSAYAAQRNCRSSFSPKISPAELFQRPLQDFVEAETQIAPHFHLNKILDPTRDLRGHLAGAANMGLWKIRVDAKWMWLKRLGGDNYDYVRERVLNEIRVAKLFQMLKIGPAVHLLLHESDYYLLSDNINGINTKTLWLERDLKSGFNSVEIQMISKILGQTFVSPKAAIEAYLRAINADPSVFAKMRRIGRILQKYHFCTWDLQFIVRPAVNGKPGQVAVIDTTYLLWHGGHYNVGNFIRGAKEVPDINPEDIVENIIQHLEP